MATLNAPPDHDDASSDAVDPRVSVVILAVASICELIAASLSCGPGGCMGLNAFAVSVGCISTLLLAPIGIVYFAEPLGPARLADALPHLSLLLLSLWLPASFLLTFVAPFTGLSNGWFATIGGVGAALNLCRAHVPTFESAMEQFRAHARGSPRERGVLLLLGLTSTAMWVQAAIAAARYGDSPATEAWAIIIGVVSSILCAFYLLLDHLTLHTLAFALLLAGWWLQGVAVSFVPSAFIGTTNGFVSTWASVFLALYFLRLTRGPGDLLPVPSAEPPDDAEPGLPTTEYHEATDGEPAPRLGPEGAIAFRHTGA